LHLEPVKFLLISDPKTMTPDQMRVANANAALVGHWLERNKQTDRGVDMSVAALRECYIALRDSGMLDFTYGQAPANRPKPQLIDNYGRVIPDKMQARRDRAAELAREAQQPRKSLESEARAAAMRGLSNQKLESIRAQVQAYRARTHSQTARAKEAMEQAISNMLNSGRRDLGDIQELETEIRRIGERFWD
jgi:hypothetical protein